MVNDVELFVEGLREDQDAWLSTALKHVQEVYQQSSAKFVVQLLAFAQLLQQLRVAVVGKRFFLGFKQAVVGTYVRTASMQARGHVRSLRPLTLPMLYDSLQLQWRTSTRPLSRQRCSTRKRSPGLQVPFRPSGSSLSPKEARGVRSKSYPGGAGSSVHPKGC